MYFLINILGQCGLPLACFFLSTEILWGFRASGEREGENASESSLCGTPTLCNSGIPSFSFGSSYS